MTLRADDGTILETKEAIVIDREGNAISSPSQAQDSDYFQSRGVHGVRVFKLSRWFAPLLIIFMLGLFLALGAFLIIPIGTFLLLLMSTRRFLNRNTAPPPR